MQPTFRSMQVLDLSLYWDNPRHSHRETQEDIIDYLLSDEEVYNLARHMSQNGINPLEVVAVFKDKKGNVVIAEGNRRICAAQLLTDVDKAPAKWRARFKALAKTSRDVSEVNVAEFPNYITAQPWLQVLHDGEQDGIGRRRWKPDQKSRATTNKSTDALAVALRDYAIKYDIIEPGERKRLQISTATRYLANPAVRKAMGLASSATSENIELLSDESRFTNVLKNFFEGIRSRKLHSRSVTADWLKYALELENTYGVPTGASRILGSKPSALSKISSQDFLKKPRVRITAPDVRFISKSNPLVEALNELSSFKLSNLYNSLISIRLDEHPALLTAGAWVFIEALTALHGKTNTDFVSYANSKMALWNLARDKIKDCKLSLEYISNNGNAQKHSGIYTAIDAQNLHNHFSILDDVLVRFLKECISKE